ncbi:MAG: pinensin family lanthipeptide [Rhodothermaceae bacterium]
MKKMKLNLTELQVDSFETAKLKDRKGTVKGNHSDFYCDPSGEHTCKAAACSYYDCPNITPDCNDDNTHKWTCVVFECIPMP